MRMYPLNNAMICVVKFELKMSRLTKRLLKLLLVIILPLNVGWVAACINGYDEEISELLRYSSFEKTKVISNKSRLEELYKQSPTIEVANDLAVVHMVLNDNQKAIDLLKEIEKQRPGLVKTATNLGTAYELLGNNTESLVWIKEGINRDPSDHQGTEWLHVKILEAKLTIAKDPLWLKKNHVMGISFGTNVKPSKPDNLLVDHLGNTHTLQQAGAALQLQLFERLKFVSEPNEVVGDLFLSLGDLTRLGLRHIDQSEDENLRAAKILYESALQFNPNAEIIQKRLSSIDFLLAEALSYTPLALFGVFLLVSVALFVFLYRKFKRNRKK